MRSINLSRTRFEEHEKGKPRSPAVAARPAPIARVLSLSNAAATAVLGAGWIGLRCAIGRSGIRAGKREGDGASPRGIFTLRRVLYRADRVTRPVTGLPVRALREQDGWCDAAGDRNYNRTVTHPYPASAERLWREDGLYDIVVVLDHNERPRIQGRGSAIFMHVARAGCRPTEGCIALSLKDLRKVLAMARPRLRVRIG